MQEFAAAFSLPGLDSSVLLLAGTTRTLIEVGLQAGGAATRAVRIRGAHLAEAFTVLFTESWVCEFVACETLGGPNGCQGNEEECAVEFHTCVFRCSVAIKILETL